MALRSWSMQGELVLTTPEITVSKADRSRTRAFGRNWNFAGRSAEICKQDWREP
ncbi:MAG: hypothetical protein K5872_09100 [Rhizobiaceae bacterium]|nr:hypothetical protein [Rhizobiaceae bacterium]MCV0406372.1 hypothetical protein [Rhizobiaceae bacterium]